MGGDKQIQRAGDGSQQYQAESITIINGVTEERVRAIFNEQNQLARKEYTEDAYRIADERVGKFEDRFMPRITQIEDAMPSFANPTFQLLLRRAQVSAATTEREADYDLLTELLVCHVQKGEERKNRAAINRAVEIVGEVDNDALCGLTAAHAFGAFSPITGNTIDGIKVLNNLFSKIIYQALPTGSDWLDHLDVLGAVRIMSFGNMKKAAEFYTSSLKGYTCVGIKAESEEYKKAVDILDAAKIDPSILIPNDCLDGYYRLTLINEKQIEDPGFNNGSVYVSLSKEKRDAIKQVWDMYETEEALKKQAENRFMVLWDSFDTLHELRRWWDSIPQAFSITQVGRVLAQTNAKRCDPSLPDLI